MLRMKWFEENYARKVAKDTVRVLDVGSFDVNGSYKDIFEGKYKYKYVGLDMEKGPNVDIVLQYPYDWSSLETDSFDIIISGQAFEHTEFFWISFAEMARVLKKDGLLCVIAPNGFAEHRYPVDCYRFFSDGMIALARYVSLEPLHVHTNCAPNPDCLDWYSRTNADSMLIASKPYEGITRYVDLKTYQCTPSQQDLLLTNFVCQKREKSVYENIKAIQENSKDILKTFIPSSVLRFLKKILHRS